MKLALNWWKNGVTSGRNVFVWCVNALMRFFLLYTDCVTTSRGSKKQWTNDWQVSDCVLSVCVCVCVCVWVVAFNERAGCRVARLLLAARQGDVFGRCQRRARLCAMRGGTSLSSLSHYYYYYYCFVLLTLTTMYVNQYWLISAWHYFRRSSRSKSKAEWNLRMGGETRAQRQLSVRVTPRACCVSCVE